MSEEACESDLSEIKKHRRIILFSSSEDEDEDFEEWHDLRGNQPRIMPFIYPSGFRIEDLKFRKELVVHLTNCRDEEISSSSTANIPQISLTNYKKKLEKCLKFEDIIKNATKSPVTDIVLNVFNWNAVENEVYRLKRFDIQNTEISSPLILKVQRLITAFGNSSSLSIVVAGLTLRINNVSIAATADRKSHMKYERPRYPPGHHQSGYHGTGWYEDEEQRLRGFPQYFQDYQYPVNEFNNTEDDENDASVDRPENNASTKTDETQPRTKSLEQDYEYLNTPGNEEELIKAEIEEDTNRH
ncbi:hypothetical protein WN51_07618 [Melipona quadrifasciata]|uniref:Uncharacterized protein n=1 Tax=Melipona quadrifasciata TaxID=166423 RepID=A0A0M8ZPE4_9HYME|nr:hypothetical protein WN51_07618 [Melipona quadrifasciata]